MTVTGDELRAAMRRFPAGIAVVAVPAELTPYGVTVASLVSLSLDPPLVGISIGVDSRVHTPLHEAGRFSVSILAGDQDSLAQHFARSVPPIALWSGIRTRGEGLIEDALAWLECRVVAAHPAGDHTIFVGEVLSLELGREAPGLVYTYGEYRQP